MRPWKLEHLSYDTNINQKLVKDPLEDWPHKLHQDWVEHLESPTANQINIEPYQEKCNPEVT